MAAVGLRPVVEVQFADYIWPGLNQLFTEVSRPYYLSNLVSNLDTPVVTMGSENMPAIPLNSTLEQTMLPSAQKVEKQEC